MQSLDPHQRPPNDIRDVYKKYQRMKLQDLDGDIGIVHIDQDLNQDPEFAHRETDASGARKGKVSIVGELESERLTAIFRSFAGSYTGDERPISSSVQVYEHKDMPGKYFSFVCSLQIVADRLYMPDCTSYTRFFHLPTVIICMFSDIG
jgi:alkylated DNA repair protein alkB family protein 1